MVIEFNRNISKLLNIFKLYFLHSFAPIYSPFCDTIGRTCQQFAMWLEEFNDDYTSTVFIYIAIYLNTGNKNFVDVCDTVVFKRLISVKERRLLLIDVCSLDVCVVHMIIWICSHNQ